VSLEETTQVALIAYCIAGFFAFLFIFLFTVVIGWTTWRLLRTSQGLMKNNVQPTLESVRQTSESVRGTVEFVSDYAIMPVIRTYATVAGAREFVAVLARLGRLRKGG
jgi:MFS superfamily sulfate permease-like transporter